MSSNNREEDDQFYHAFGEHTGISKDCRDLINRIKNNAKDEYGDSDLEIDTFNAENFTDMAWRLLGRYIANNIHLSELNFDDCGITDVIASLLFRELVSTSSKFKFLHITGSSFGIDGLRCMVPLLQNSERLLYINFNNNNNLNSECFELLIKTIRGRQVRKLFLQRCSIEHISVLETHTPLNLLTLHLENNNIGREGCVTLSKMLQKEGTKLAELYLNSTGIGDEGAEVLGASLRNNTTLHTLRVSNNNITERGKRAFSKLLVDISSIDNTYNNSNHTLTSLKLDGDKTEESCIINSDYPHAAGRVKVIRYQLNSKSRKDLCRTQDVEYCSNPFTDIEPELLPNILALIGREHGQSQFYAAILPVAPDLMSFINREAMLLDERAKNMAKISALTAEYERKLALLTTEGNGINNRLALIKLGDSEQSIAEKGKQGGGGDKRQRIN